jgi:hypothetical protein
MSKILFLFTLLLLIFKLEIHSQETVLNAKKVPTIIKDYIRINYPEAEHIKYYREHKHDTIFIECEFKLKTDKYFLLFLQNGDLFETEEFISFKEIEIKIASLIKNVLAQQFKKYRIGECFVVNPQTYALYEIEVEGTIGKKRGTYEVYFDKAGNLIKIEEVIIKPISTIF